MEVFEDFFLDSCIWNCTGPSSIYFDGFGLFDSEGDFEESIVQSSYANISPCRIGNIPFTS